MKHLAELPKKFLTTTTPSTVSTERVKHSDDAPRQIKKTDSYASTIISNKLEILPLKSVQNKRKRIHLGDGTLRNLTLPEGRNRENGEVIDHLDSVMSFGNIKGEMNFQRVNEFNIALTKQLIYLYKVVIEDTETARRFRDTLAFEISIRPNYNEAVKQLRRGVC